MAQQRTILTVGHGPLGRADLSLLLQTHGVQTLVDVRRFPKSRHNADVSSESLVDWLPAAGIAYHWDERLGGRRRIPAGYQAVDVWWQVEAFRAYAAHTRTAEFQDALANLLSLAASTTVAVMCSETVWWRCHRRLIADVLVLGHGVPVEHLVPSQPARAHLPSSGARVDSPGLLVWDSTED